jgi:hypothetical protein
MYKDTKMISIVITRNPSLLLPWLSGITEIVVELFIFSE